MSDEQIKQAEKERLENGDVELDVDLKDFEMSDEEHNQFIDSLLSSNSHCSINCLPKNGENMLDNLQCGAYYNSRDDYTV